MISIDYKDMESWEIYSYYKKRPDEIEKLTYEEFQKLIDHIFKKANERWKYRTIILIGEKWERLDNKKKKYLLDILCTHGDESIWLVEAGEKWDIDKDIAKKILICIEGKQDGLKGVYEAGTTWDTDIFPFEEAMRFFEEKDRNGLYTAKAGSERFGWSEFDYEKGLEIILENDKIGEAIYIVGRDWPKSIIDYDTLLDYLIEVDKNGKWIYRAGLKELGWPEFDYEKGYETLKKIGNNTWLKRARIFWPKVPENAIVYFY